MIHPHVEYINKVLEHITSLIEFELTRRNFSHAMCVFHPEKQIFTWNSE